MIVNLFDTWKYYCKLDSYVIILAIFEKYLILVL